MVSVGVLIDLPWRSDSGGHVKSWERFAQAALALPERLDLTLYFLGDRSGQTVIGPTVRYCFQPPRWGTDRLPFLHNVADHTDLAPFHPALAAQLQHHDVLHATHQLFSFGKTALRLSQRQQIPLVASIHTDVPYYTEIYTQTILQQMLGDRGLGGALYHSLIHGLQFPQRRRQAMERQIQHYYRSCRHVWTSQAQDHHKISLSLSPDRHSHLRRGIDKTLFHPQHRDRRWLQHTYGIAPEIPVTLFVGRLNACKNVILAAQTLRRLREQSIDVKGIFVGKGPLKAEIQEILGENAIFPGQLAPVDLAPLYASADLFLFPSTTETYGNVVLEARASGLAVAITDQGGVGQFLGRSGQDGLCIPELTPEAWAATLAPWLQQPDRLRALGTLAQHQVHTTWPSWQDVLAEDLLPVWQRYASPPGGR